MTDSTGQLRQYLARTWYPFLGRFPQPTLVQMKAIPRVLAGESVLLASATATGKTEAYAAPLVERLLREKWGCPAHGSAGGVCILIVSPTRALVNDLFRRLEGPFSQLGVPLGRKTGDYAALLRSEDKQALPSVLITTPESFDSMLSRQPQVLRTVRAVVLDELHVLDGTARGDQLAVLVTRLERLVMGTAAQAAVRGDSTPHQGTISEDTRWGRTEHDSSAGAFRFSRGKHASWDIPLQRVAATATAASADEVARCYLGPRASVVTTDERRAIEADLIGETSPPALMQYFRESRASRKVLVFTNSRAEAEDYAVACSGLAPFGRDVFVHHASLARAERERVEERFLTASSALCFATTTLELGIDIGDIDRIGLIGPPPDVQGLLQRVGRGNRRLWDVTRVACFYRTSGQRARFEHMLDCARRGELHTGERTFRPSVLVQQATSLIYQNRGRWLDARSLHDRLPQWVAARYTENEIEAMLSHLASDGWLATMGGGRYGPSERTDRLYVRGLMHSNISSRDDQDIEVVDAATERVVGYVSARSSETQERRGRQAARAGGTPRGAPPVGDKLVLGGKKRQVQRVSDRQIRVSSGGPAVGAQFAAWSSPSISFGLARSFAAFLGIAERQMPVFQDGNVIILGHFLGSAYGRILIACLLRSIRGLTAAGNAFVAALATSETPMLHFRESEVLAAIGKHRRALSTALGDGPTASRLPPGWWTGWLAESLDVPRFLEIIDTSRLQDTSDKALRDVLLTLAPRTR